MGIFGPIKRTLWRSMGILPVPPRPLYFAHKREDYLDGDECLFQKRERSTPSTHGRRLPPWEWERGQSTRCRPFSDHKRDM